ncbi:MAG: branched-chain amino acid ABC transporter permease [Firmicutes bacterium]|nr:branched-chain amino acid ABC transporter permease [Bacillota bacterium]
MRTTTFKDCNILRLLVFVILPLCAIVYGASHPSGYYAGLINLAGIYIILVASLNLVNGFSGMFSMGHAAFMAIGAYISAFFTLTPAQKMASTPGLPEWLINANLPFVVALIIGGACAVVVALIIGYPVLRFKGHYLSIVTLGLIVIVRAVLDNEGEYTNGARGITGLPSKANTVVIFIIMAIVLYFLFRLIRSQYGRGLIAMRDDDVAAQTLGINLASKKLSAFCISAFITGMAGGLFGHMQSVISGKFYYFDLSFRVVQTSIIGGMFSLSGAVPGGIIMAYLPEVLAPLETGVKLFGHQLPEMYGASNLIMAIILILIIIFRRQGLMGEHEFIVESMFSKDTYTSLFKKEEYLNIGRAFRDLFTGKWRKSKKALPEDIDNTPPVV